MRNEVWKQIPSYEGYYEVSDMGNVRSIDREVVVRRSSGSYYLRKSGRLLRSCINSNGYVAVGLCKDSIVKQFRVHQLVAMAFLGHTICGHDRIVDHIDGNRMNNKLSNLRIISQRENCFNRDYKRKVTSKYTGVYFDKTKKRWVAQIRVNGVLRNLGRFREEIDAANAYLREANKLIDIN